MNITYAKKKNPRSQFFKPQKSRASFCWPSGSGEEQNVKSLQIRRRS